MKKQYLNDPISEYRGQRLNTLRVLQKNKHFF